MSMSAAVTHPVMLEMSSTGCKDQKAISLAFQTYMELCEVEILWNVEHHFNEELDLIYLSAAEKSDGEKNVYVPISYLHIITPEWLVETRKQMEERHKNSIITIVIRGEDTTVVHYKLSPGLVPPLSPNATKLKKIADEKRQLFEHEIRKRKYELIASAKEGSKHRQTTDEKADSNKDITNDDSNDVCEVSAMETSSSKGSETGNEKVDSTKDVTNEDSNDVCEVSVMETSSSKGSETGNEKVDKTNKDSDDICEVTVMETNSTKGSETGNEERDSTKDVTNEDSDDVCEVTMMETNSSKDCNEEIDLTKDKESVSQVPITVTIDEDGDSSQSKHVEVIEL
ncbi:uncharacterized protein LOC111043826 [Nilaparvata lugens]|uniref:uncharacterized protein LOC111043826 n=1 Tax=Nilaparvata lugens TaxID=108931 RepID=UPI00193D126B|nr:uncharacterized protein LOC111043826 [Nilaparvata lugens]